MSQQEQKVAKYPNSFLFGATFFATLQGVIRISTHETLSARPFSYLTCAFFGGLGIWYYDYFRRRALEEVLYSEERRRYSYQLKGMEKIRIGQEHEIVNMVDYLNNSTLYLLLEFSEEQEGIETKLKQLINTMLIPRRDQNSRSTLVKDLKKITGQLIIKISQQKETMSGSGNFMKQMILRFKKHVGQTRLYIFASSDNAQSYFLSVQTKTYFNAFLVAICSNSILLPLFLTSKDQNHEVIAASQSSSLERLTLINAQERYSMVWVVFFFTILYSLLGHILLYYFDEKRKALQVQIHDDKTVLTELEISNHSVLLRGINKNIPIRYAQMFIDHIFNGVSCIEGKLVRTYVVGDYMKMLQYLKKLDRMWRKKEYYMKIYREKHLDTKKQKGILCFKTYGSSLKDYYAQKPSLVKEQMNLEMKIKQKRNFGVAFIMIDNTLDVNDLLSDFNELKKDIKEWDSQITGLQNMLLVLLIQSGKILTSVIIQSINPFIKEYYSSDADQSSFISALILNSITPFILMMFNYIFIPTLVGWTSYFEEIENISTRHRNNLFKQFLFMMINTVFIPITQTTTILSFLYYLRDRDIDDLQIELSEKFLKTSEFFLKYIIQCTFMTNIVQILDIPHFIYMKLKRLFMKSRNYEQDEIEDDWYFDLGYHFAFSITIFSVVYIFSAAVPLIPLFGFLFFAFKYYIDKYNFLFVYNMEADSRGNLGQAVIRYITFGLLLYQLIMFGLFTSIFGRDFTVASIILLVGEILYMIVFRIFSLSELREAFKQVLYEQEDEEEDEEDNLKQREKFSKLLSSKTLARKDKKFKVRLSDKNIAIIKDAYLHPYEKYQKQENAKRLLNGLKKVIKIRNTKNTLDQADQFATNFSRNRSRTFNTSKSFNSNRSSYPIQRKYSMIKSGSGNFNQENEIPIRLKKDNSMLTKIIEEDL
ncbi:integral membrane protein [Stylonychia lemnae]|uniref:Integral membrane protein n=1 Tax=Stylonychia lemnae TaxID=5949 RepID=A0A078AFI3_STYLE|nr:integral membrane protein [Stylonychia lemnae]|eukprot:CDW80277.1 integral membrane protein [Stylonychia lemnae]